MQEGAADSDRWARPGDEDEMFPGISTHTSLNVRPEALWSGCAMSYMSLWFKSSALAVNVTVNRSIQSDWAHVYSAFKYVVTSSWSSFINLQYSKHPERLLLNIKICSGLRLQYFICVVDSFRVMSIICSVCSVSTDHSTQCLVNKRI